MDAELDDKIFDGAEKSDPLIRGAIGVEEAEGDHLVARRLRAGGGKRCTELCLSSTRTLVPRARAAASLHGCREQLTSYTLSTPLGAHSR